MKKIFVIDATVMGACYREEKGMDEVFARIKEMKDVLWIPDMVAREFKNYKVGEDAYRKAGRRRQTKFQKEVAQFVFNNKEDYEMESEYGSRLWVLNESQRSGLLFSYFSKYVKNSKDKKLQLVYVTPVKETRTEGDMFTMGPRVPDICLDSKYKGKKRGDIGESVLPLNLVDNRVKDNICAGAEGSAFRIYDAEQFFNMSDKAFRYLVFDEAVMSDDEFKEEVVSELIEGIGFKVGEIIKEKYKNPDEVLYAILNSKCESLESSIAPVNGTPVACYDSYLSCAGIYDHRLIWDEKNNPIYEFKYILEGHTGITLEIERMSGSMPHESVNRIKLYGQAMVAIDIKCDLFNKLNRGKDTVTFTLIEDKVFENCVGEELPANSQNVNMPEDMDDFPFMN